MRDRYAREILAATETMKNQKSTIDAMSETHRIDREKLQKSEASVSERDGIIGGLITRIECLQKLYQSMRWELDARNRELLEMRNKVKEIIATSFESNPASHSDQPQKPMCDN
jgi:hypothetical protein